MVFLRQLFSFRLACPQSSRTRHQHFVAKHHDLARASIGLLSFVGLALLAVPTVAVGQTTGHLGDEVSVSGNVYVGENWSFTIYADSGGGDVQPCDSMGTSCYTSFGTATPGNPLYLSGTYWEGEEEQWNEYWYINGAYVGSLAFYIHPASCTPSWTGSPQFSLSATDVYDYYTGLYEYTSGGSATDHYSVPSSYCEVTSYNGGTDDRLSVGVYAAGTQMSASTEENYTFEDEDGYGFFAPGTVDYADAVGGSPGGIEGDFSVFISDMFD